MDPDYEVLDRAAVTLDDLKDFRRLGSRCPGHPEYGFTPERVAELAGDRLAAADGDSRNDRAQTGP